MSRGYSWDNKSELKKKKVTLLAKDYNGDLLANSRQHML
jgi:hypothetical protein